MRQLIIATRNKGKIREIKQILEDIPFEMKSLDELGLKEEIVEVGRTFEENAILKVRIIGEKTGFLTLAEDSGLEVGVLDGRPGIYSARYAEGTDLDRINKVLSELKNIPREKRTARFRSVIAIYNPTTNKVQTFEGFAQGYITYKPIGENGFGYDPIFFSPELGKTFGQASDKEKNKVSHRARALQRVKKFLKRKKL